MKATMRYGFALAALPFAFAAPIADADIQSTKYIVVMKPNQHVQTLGIQEYGTYQNVDMIHQYNSGDFKGFAAYLSPNQVNALSKDPKI
jgi:hypothetical protein